MSVTTPQLSRAQDECYFRLRMLQRAQPDRSFTMTELCEKISSVVDCRAQMIYRLRNKVWSYALRVTTSTDDGRSSLATS